MIRWIAWAMVLVGLGAALVSARHRWLAETDNRTVDITLDYAELRALAAAEGRPLSTVLARFRRAGATSVALQEETIGGLEENRRLEVLPPPDRSTTVLQAGPDVYARVLAALSHKTRFALTPQAETGQITVGQTLGLVRAVGIGIDNGAARGVQKAGLRIVGRVGNYAGVTPEGIEWSLGELRRNNIQTVLFSGDEILGYKGYIADAKDSETLSGGPTTQSVLTADNFRVGTVEFSKMRGDIETQKAVPERIVRVHTVLGSEMATADIPGNVQRFLLAARERNIRMLFVRLFLSEKDPLETNADYVSKIAQGLRRARLIPGAAHGYEPLHVSVVLRGLMGLGLAGAFLLLADAVTGVFSPSENGVGKLTIALTSLGALLLCALPLAPNFTGAKLAALAAACVYPSLALLHSDKLRPDNANKRVLLLALTRFFVTTLITALGIAAIIGLLADRLFLIKTDAFVGIKGAQLVPVLLVALVYGLPLRADPGARQKWGTVLRQAWARVADFGAQPMRYWQVGAALLALAVLVFLVMRSGNDPGVGVSAAELKFRALLDRVMPARPRFKEFAFGHPALLLAFVLAIRGWRKIALPLFLVGAIGQVSLLNTFCHLHTPIPVSLARALLGLGFGVIIGLVLYLILDRLVLRHLPPARATF